MIAETNQNLAERKAELLYAVYPSDGVAFANSPLGFVDRGTGDATRKFFHDIQAHLLSRDVQAKLVSISAARRSERRLRDCRSRNGTTIHAAWLP